MSEAPFQEFFEALKQQAELLDKQLRLITKAKIDVNESDWLEKLAQAPHPADQAGLRDPIRSFFNDLIARFETLETSQRQLVIDFMDQCDSLMHSRIIAEQPNTPDGFRKHMILFAIEDQGKDTRDAILSMEEYRSLANMVDFDIETIINDVAELASRQDKYGWGSTHDLMLNKR